MSICRGVARSTPQLLRNGLLLSKSYIRQTLPLSDSGKITGQIRLFHSSHCLLAAKKGKAAATGADIVLPDTKDLDLQMEKKLTRVIDEFAKLRNGQPNTELFRTVMVNSNGGRVSVADSGQLSVKSPIKMTITVFDPTQVNSVAEAIKDCGMGLTPMVEGNSISMSIPKPSKESREALIKTAKMIADKVSQSKIHHHTSSFCVMSFFVFFEDHPKLKVDKYYLTNRGSKMFAKSERMAWTSLRN